MNYFLPSADFGPPRYPSKFSRLVDIAWSLDPERHEASKTIYDSIIPKSKFQEDKQPPRYSSSSATLFPTLFEDKQWIVSYKTSRSHNHVDPLVDAVTSCLDEILPDASGSTIPELRPMEFAGEDVVKLMILVRGIGS